MCNTFCIWNSFCIIHSIGDWWLSVFEVQCPVFLCSILWFPHAHLCLIEPPVARFPGALNLSVFPLFCWLACVCTNLSTLYDSCMLLSSSSRFSKSLLFSRNLHFCLGPVLCLNVTEDISTTSQQSARWWSNESTEMLWFLNCLGPAETQRNTSKTHSLINMHHYKKLVHFKKWLMPNFI